MSVRCRLQGDVMLPQLRWPGPVTVQRMMQTTQLTLTVKMRKRGVVSLSLALAEICEKGIFTNIKYIPYSYFSEKLSFFFNNVKTNELTPFKRGGKEC